ncbi:MAG: hypothetical protein U0324_15290 [Polyangiales bacterium]
MTRLATLFEVRRRFFRSVQVARDAQRRDACEGYALTPLGAGLLRRIVEGARGEGTARAWSLTGPYGAGKSAFVVFLTQLIGAVPADATATALHELRGVDRALEGRVRALADSRRFCPVLVSGTYGPLLPSLLDAVERAVAMHYRPSEAQRRLLDASRAIRQSRAKSADLHARVVRLFEELGDFVASRGGAGVLLVVDELGKALEHAARSPGRVDEVFLLQELAEAAARSGDRPLVVVTLLHQAFDRYARDLAAETRAEWSKVQGRFEDVAFLEAPGELLRLAALALRPRGPAALLRPYDALAAEAVALGLAAPELEPTLRGVAPIHPTVALVLPALFRGPMAQNERSLFGFLTSGVDDAFGAFLDVAETRPDGATAYTLDRLYDFVASTLGPGQFAGATGRRWAAVDEALARLPRDAPPLAARILKAVGVLDLLGSRTVRASRAVLAFALADATTTAAEVGAAVDHLAASSHVVYRRFSDAYALWEGSDIDLDARFDDARKAPPDVHALSAHLSARLVLRPWVARRHFIETGTLRYFDVSLATADVAAPDAPREADGQVVYLVSDQGASHRDLVHAATRASAASDVVIGVPQEARSLLDGVRDWFAWDAVRQSASGLDGDPVARRELTARLHAASQRVDDDLLRCFGLAEGARVAWVHAGAVTDWRGARSLSAALSAVCDRNFPDAPLVRNELLNRKALSSAAAAARRELLNAMVTRSGEPDLGLTGTPPERSMYASLLSAGGLHRARDGAWGFAPPPPDDPLRLLPAWRAVERFLDDAEREPQPLSSLYAALRQRPIGMREGPMPVLLFAVMLSARGEVALFEDGTFIAELSEAVVERLLRRPDHFAASRHRVAGARATAARLLWQRLGGDGEAPPVELVRAVVRRVASLPRHARTTRALPPTALAVRDAVLHARDPLRLLFADLPAALDLAPVGVDDDALVAPFLERLGGALDALSAAYGSLLADVERALAAAFAPEVAGDALREALSARARALLGVATDLRLRAFLGRAVEPSSDHAAWLEGVATVVHHRPPSEWSDGERARFEVSLGEVRALFLRAEALVRGATARVQVPAVGDPEAVARAEADILRVLEASLGARRDVWLAALGRTLNRVLDEGGTPGS